MLDDSGEAFNPFHIGPNNNGLRHDFSIPRTPTYPPPVFATWPPPKEHTNKSVSQGTLLAERQREANRAAGVKQSQMGEMTFSKAIKEEMAAAKRHAAEEEERINAGRVSRGDSRSTMGAQGDETLTLLPVRAHRSDSGSNFDSRMSIHSQKSKKNDSTTTLKSSNNHMKPQRKLRESARDRDMIDPNLQRTNSVRSAASRGSQHADNASRSSHRSRERNRAGEESSEENLTPDHLDDNISRHSMRSKADDQQDSVSRISLRSRAGDQQAGNVSNVSMRSARDEQQADNVSNVYIRSTIDVQPPDNISQMSIRSTMKDPQPDNISRMSKRSGNDNQQLDNVSRMSIRSRRDDPQMDNVSRISTRSKNEDQQADNKSHISTKSQKSNMADNVSHVSIRSKKNDQQGDNVSRISTKVDQPADNKSQISTKSKRDNEEETKREGDNVSLASKKFQMENKEKPRQSVREMTEEIQKELRGSMTSTKALYEKAVSLGNRLRAGNEHNHNRFSSLIHQYTNTEPLKRCREDRISLWFKDAVLS